MARHISGPITRLTPLDSAGTEAAGVPSRPASPVVSPWMTLLSAAAYLDYATATTAPAKAADAVRKLAERHRIPMFRRGRRLMIDRRDLDSWLRAQRVA